MKETEERLSPNTEVDWTNEKEVDDYYNSFEKWRTYIRNGDVKARETFEIKNNKVLVDGEYYLPFEYIGSTPGKAEYRDGLMFGYVTKKTNNRYDSQDGITVNIFMAEKLISTKEFEAQDKKLIAKEKLPVIDYLKVIDFNRLTSNDLNLLKGNFTHLFNPDIFPYTTKHKRPVTFSFGCFDRIEVHHRSRQGYLEIDNSYHGSMPYNNDHGAFLRVTPYFTNQSYVYSPRVENPDLKFNKKNLDKLASQVIKVWDKAIEENATLRF